jgi:hypothetical protein
MLREHKASLTRSLERVHGCEEWALNLYVDKTALSEKIANLSPRLMELLSRAEKSSEGQAYLLQKQAEKMRATETKDYLKRTADEIASHLAPSTREMKRIPAAEHETKQTPAVAGKFAYLVAREKLETFKAEAERMAVRHAGSGFRLELTGPWPPYNFIE